MSEGAALENAVKSASYNIILQILMRILSSISNAIVLRFIEKEALGVINVRLILLYSTCQFFSREAFRRSCLSKFNVYNFQKKVNLLWLSIPTCFFCVIVLGYVWLYWLEMPSNHLEPNYTLGVFVVLISVFVEMFAEPVYVFSQSYHFVKLKVFIEGLCLTLKSMTMIVFLWMWPGNAIGAFCISQLLCSCVYAAAFYCYFWWYFKSPHKEVAEMPIHTVKRLLPDLSHFKMLLLQFIDWQNLCLTWSFFTYEIFSICRKLFLQFIDSQDLCLTWSFFKQTLLKQLLTEGERYVMTFFSVMSFAEQGLYDVVSNLGSLSARFIFFPIEDSGYHLFTQLLSRDKKTNSIENLSKCLQILEKLLRLLLLLGLTILTFGYSYSRLLLLLYGGSSLSSDLAVTLLRWHCAYVLLLALNGITECFKFAVMSPQQLDAYNKSLVFLSSGFLFAAFFLAKIFGGVGFIMANCLNMGLRIVHSIHFINRYFNVYGMNLMWKVIPHPFVLISLGTSLGLTSFSEVYFCCDQGFKVWIWHLGLGMCCFAVFLACVAFKEMAAVKFIYDQRSNKKIKSA